MAGYDFATIERKWQDHWAAHETFRQPNPGEEGFADRPKMYVLDMFPYPSGAGLHVGHPEGYTATDIVCRHARMRGRNVLHPMGYDAFGLPAEQYAVQHGIHPQETTAENIANIERQIKMFGFSYDWSRRVATTDVSYYRWTQWIFLRMFHSWYDPEADAARPISELIHKFESGEYVVGPTGEATFNVSDGMAPLLGDTPGTSKWHELTPAERRAVIDGYRLAYMAEVPVNWCPMLGTVLANEEVTNEGRSERGNHPVYRRALKQWMLRITAYAERLENDLEMLDWPEPIKIMQRNWIGRSTGAEVDFPLESLANDAWFAERAASGHPAVEEDEVIRVYTTRPDTLFGATYMVLAPEHALVRRITTDAQRPAVKAYVAAAANKSELERTAETKEKTGVFTGAYAINPVNRERIPVLVADYVLLGYGTGAIMAVPAHDTRDFEFAQHHGLEINYVVGEIEETAEARPGDGYKPWKRVRVGGKRFAYYRDHECFEGEGLAINSGEYDGLPTVEFKAKITEDLQAAGLGQGAVNYKLRDWLFSRQRYWGEPFPIVHCERCGTVAVPEDQLPLELPEMDDFTPEASEDPAAPPKPPLGKLTEWVRTECPECGGPATRELNTMPQWAGSCWYYLRYLDPRNEQRFCDGEIERYWMAPAENAPAGGVDLYVGGAEHAVLHLLYARFWHKVLFDLGEVSSPEPFRKLFNQGMIRSYAYRDGRGVSIAYTEIDHRDDGAYQKATGEKLIESVEKMSKSLGNVVNPDEVIAEYGADTFRLYEMFMGPLEASKPWNTQDVPGVHRFLNRVWRMVAGDDEGQAPLLGDGPAADEIEKALHRLVKKVGEDIEAMKFNTAIAAMMEFVNAVYKAGAIAPGQAERLVLVLSPFAPHLAEELWQRLGHAESLAHEPWPAYDEARIAEETIEMPVQVNGKRRASIAVPADADNDAVVAAALAHTRIIELTAGKTIVKKIVVPGRLVNLVVK